MTPKRIIKKTPSRKLKNELVTTEQGLKFAEKDKERILDELEKVTVKISNYKEEILQMELAVLELEKKGL